MKRVIALLLCLILCLGLLVACGDDAGEHTHTYATSWSHDSQSHWYDATCECEDAPITKLYHVDANNDGACDVCALSNCAHEYSEDWTVDCTNHWHAASCGHIVAGTGVEAHADTNADGKCDTCGYVINDIHQHYFDKAWTTDAEYHWHAALCEHGVEIADKAAHELNAAGFCTVCGAKVKDVDKTDLLAMLSAAIANNDKVVDGNVVKAEIVYGGNAEAPIVENFGYNEIYYVLGNKGSYVNYKTLGQDGSIVGAEQMWFEFINDEEIFGVMMENSSFDLIRVDGTPDKRNGYTYMPGNILSAADNTDTLSVTLYELYNLGKASADFAEAYDEESGAYSFAYTTFSVNKIEGSDESGNETVSYYVEYYTVTAGFTFDENYVIDLAVFEVNSFRNSAIDDDLTYDPETNTVTLKDTANATTYSYMVTQNSGERTFTTPYPKASITPRDFELYNVEAFWNDNVPSELEITNSELITDSATVEADKFAYFFLGDPTPVTALFSFIDAEDISVTFVNNDAESDAVLWTVDPYYSTYEGYIGFYAKDVGSYTVTVTYGDVVKTFTVVVEEPETPEIIVGENEFTVETTETYEFVDEYTFTADAEGKYTFTLPAGLGFFSKNKMDSSPFAAPEVDFYANAEGGATVTFELEAGASYVYYVGATTKGEWVISYTFEACEVEGSQGGSQGGADYTTVLAAGPNVLYFSPDEISADTATRQLVITEAGVYQFAAGNLFVSAITAADGTVINRNATYDYNLEAGEYTVTFGMLSMFGVSADTAYQLNVNNRNAQSGEDEGDDPVINIEGTYYGSDAWGNQFLTVVINADTVEFNYNHQMMGSSNAMYTYAIVDGQVVLYDEDGNVVDAMAGLITLEAGVPVTADYNGTTYTLSTTQGGGSDDNNGTGTESDPYVWDELPESVTFESDTFNKVYYLFTAIADGTVTFTWPTADSWADIFEMNGTSTTANSDSSSETTEFAFYVEAGKTYRVSLGTWALQGEVTITVSFTEGTNPDVGGGDAGNDDNEGLGDVEIKQSIVDGTENTVSLTVEEIDAKKVYVSFMPDFSGEYYFVSNDLSVANVYTAEGTKVEVNDDGKYVLEAYSTYTLEVSTEYAYGAGDYTLEPRYEYPAGSQEKPIWIEKNYDTDEFDETTTECPIGWTPLWHTFIANKTGTLTITTNSEAVTIFISAAFGYEIEGTGTVTLPVTSGRQYYLGFIDYMADAAYELTFDISITEEEIVTNGTVNVPHVVVLGDSNVATVEMQGTVYFMYTATANGTLTLSTEVANCAWKIGTSLSELVMNSVSSDPITLWLEVDQIAYIYIETSDYAAAEINFTASFEADPVTDSYMGHVINDGSAANEIVIEDNTMVSLTFPGNGNFAITWDNEDAVVAIDNTVIENGAIVEGSMYGGTELIIYLPDYAAGTVNLTITPQAPEGLELVVGDNIVAVTDTWHGTNVVFTAPETATYVFTAGTNAFVGYDYSNYEEGDSFTVDMVEGQSIAFIVLTGDFSEGDAVVIISIQEAGAAPAAVEGQYKYIDPDDGYHRWVITFNEDGTGTLAEQNFASLSWSTASSTEITYTYEDGTVTIDFADGAACADGSYSVVSGFVNGVNFNGSAVNFEYFN